MTVHDRRFLVLEAVRADLGRADSEQEEVLLLPEAAAIEAELSDLMPDRLAQVGGVSHDPALLAQLARRRLGQALARLGAPADRDPVRLVPPGRVEPVQHQHPPGGIDDQHPPGSPADNGGLVVICHAAHRTENHPPGARRACGGQGMIPSRPQASMGGTVSTDQTELDQLRAEVADLKVKLRQADGPGRGRRRAGWRGPVSALLIVLGCVLAPISVLAVWTANQVSDTSRYVRTISPLIREPAVRRALTDKIASAVTARLDVQAVARQAARQVSARGLTRLGSLLSNFSGSIASGINGVIHNGVAKVVASPAATRLWVQGNTLAHTQLVRALSGRKSALTVSNGKVVVGLGPFVSQVKHNLAGRGVPLVDKLPPINPSFSLFSAKYLVQAQSFYRLLTTLRWVLPILTIVLLAAGIYVARRHRRALIGAALGLAGSMLVLAAALAIGRAIYLSKIPDSTLPADAAAVVFDAARPLHPAGPAGHRCDRPDHCRRRVLHRPFGDGSQD